jgi:hypothetical protein
MIERFYSASSVRYMTSQQGYARRDKISELFSCSQGVQAIMSDDDKLRPWHLLYGGEIGCLALACGYIVGPLCLGGFGYWIGSELFGNDWIGFILAAVGVGGALIIAKYVACGSIGGLLVGGLVYFVAQNSSDCWWYTLIAASTGFVIVSVGLFVVEMADKRKKIAQKKDQKISEANKTRTAEQDAAPDCGGW